MAAIEGMLGVLLPTAFAGAGEMQDSIRFGTANAARTDIEEAWKHLRDVASVVGVENLSAMASTIHSRARVE